MPSSAKSVSPFPLSPRGTRASTSSSVSNAPRQLAALLTHRLSTLTSTISGYADLLIDTPEVQEQRKLVMNVLEATTEIDDLLADLRYYSRPLQPTPRPLRVRAVARDVTGLLDAPHHERVRWDVTPDEDGEIHADPQLLRQALLGLLQNALQATAPAGTVHLRIRLAGEEAKDWHVAFEVWNDGVIALDNPQHVFQPFFTTRARQLGLGLPIARDIAEQHGGHLELTSSNPESGRTCFTLHI